MNPSQDAVGRLLLDLHRGRPAVEIVERSDGRVQATTGPDAYFAPFAAWPALQRRAMDAVRGRVLDLGCGAGRHALHLQQQGFDVVGIDNSPLAIEVCRLRGVRCARALDIADVDEELGTFDTLLMLWNNFGLFASRSRARHLLRRFSGMTSSGGRLVAESKDPYRSADARDVLYHRANLGAGRLPGQYRIRVRCGETRTPWFDYLFVSKEEMAELVEGTGWSLEGFLEGEGSSYIGIFRNAGS